MAVVSLLALVLAVVHFREKPAEVQPVRFLVPLADKVTLRQYDFPVVSPNGRRLIFSGVDSASKGHLWLHSLDSLTTQSLIVADDAYGPFWSPDSRFVGVFGGGKLMKIDVSGGVPETLCDANFALGTDPDALYGCCFGNKLTSIRPSVRLHSFSLKALPNPHSIAAARFGQVSRADPHRDARHQPHRSS